MDQLLLSSELRSFIALHRRYLVLSHNSQEFYKTNIIWHSLQGIITKLQVTGMRSCRFLSCFQIAYVCLSKFELYLDFLAVCVL